MTRVSRSNSFSVIVPSLYVATALLLSSAALLLLLLLLQADNIEKETAAANETSSTFQDFVLFNDIV
ncbi:hypothetical protein D3C75_799320 [compost metagenome]